MEADFSGYATKAGLVCADGRTILPHAFKHQDTNKVPLVWQHGHSDPENVLGHAILENREDGVYCYGFFNKSPKAIHTAGLLEHKDIRHLSIWANNLVERGGKVLHGVIREVSLVLSGANPGAVIESVTIRHDSGVEFEAEDEAIIHTGLPLEYIPHTSTEAKEEEKEVKEDQKEDALAHADEDLTIQDVYDSMTDEQKKVLHFMVGQALEDAQQDAMDDESTKNSDSDKEGNGQMSHNVFDQEEQAKKKIAGPTLSHDDMKEITADATKRFGGSLRESLKEWALQHGIDNIDLLFPEARNITGTPEFLKRRTEWVDAVLGGARKTPFSRIKTMSADITMEEARAKGYVKGNLKKEEFFNVSRRITTPQTVYKKQKLDRDDVVDITDFDVVAWLKAEMRLMLEEELARAILIGDGRDVSDADKIQEGNIRPIATDHELYVTTITVNLDDASSSYLEAIEHIILNRGSYKGSGLPTLFTTETTLARFLLLKDTTGRRLYRGVDELATDLRVSNIVTVEVMEGETDLVGIMVNMQDYVIGADQGGQVSMFEDFDIDYNQQKYLIETRISGALARLKSAIVIRKTASGSDTVVVPVAPTFDSETGEVTITDTTGVVYKDQDGVTVNAAGSPYELAAGEEMTVTATAASGKFLASNANTSWRFVYRGA